MKNKFIALMALISLAAAGTASATVTIRISGSTAFRASTVTAIKAVMSGGSPQYAWQSSSSFTGANYHIFKGTVAGIADPNVIVKCSWSGSVAGIKSVTTNQLLTFLADATPTSTSPTTAANGANVAAGNLTANEGAPVICMTDNYQGSTKYTTPTLTDDTIVGVVPFKWVASFGAPASLTNVNFQSVKQFLAAGYISGSMVSGNPANASDQVGGFYIYAAGRDPLSGTRVGAFAESDYGVKSEAVQFRPKTVASNIVSEIEITPADPANDAINPGDGGETSGGNLADKMRYTTTNVVENSILGYTGKMVFITYLGLTDADRAINGTGSNTTGANSGGAKELTWNGVPYSQANVENGYYTFWNYEHIMVKSGQPNAAALRALLVPQIQASPGASGIALSGMRVQRTDDGGPISQLY